MYYQYLCHLHLKHIYQHKSIFIFFSTAKHAGGTNLRKSEITVREDMFSFSYDSDYFFSPPHFNFGKQKSQVAKLYYEITRHESLCK